MKVTRCFVVAFVILFLISVAMQEEGYCESGEFLAEAMQEYEKDDSDITKNFFLDGFYQGYITGVYDTRSFLFNVSSETSREQIIFYVGKFLKDNPHRWHEPASDLVIEAVMEASALQ